jgi:hypothetical protein
VVVKEVAVVKVVGDAAGGEAAVGGELEEVEPVAPDVGYILYLPKVTILSLTISTAPTRW